VVVAHPAGLGTIGGAGQCPTATVPNLATIGFPACRVASCRGTNRGRSDTHGIDARPSRRAIIPAGQRPTTAVANGAAVVIPAGSRTGHGRAHGRCCLAHVVVTRPSRRAIVAAVQRSAAAVADGPAVVVPARCRTGQRLAHGRRSHAQVVDTVPSRRTSVAAVERVAATISDLPTVVVAGRRQAGRRLTHRRIALADALWRAFPPVLRAHRRTVELAAAAISNRSAIGPAWVRCTPKCTWFPRRDGSLHCWSVAQSPQWRVCPQLSISPQ